MFVENRRIYTAGEYIYNMFEDAADKHFYLCSDKVADFSRISMLFACPSSRTDARDTKSALTLFPQTTLKLPGCPILNQYFPALGERYHCGGHRSY